MKYVMNCSPFKPDSSLVPAVAAVAAGNRGAMAENVAAATAAAARN
jgi:hypothetical protein